MFFEDEEFTNKKPEGSLYIENIDNDDWYINDGVLEECRKSDAEEMEIPEGVTSINTYAIMDNYSVKSIHLPKTVKRLESTGIAECGNLTKVVIDNPDIEIMEWGLSYNEALKEVYIGGKKVDSIVAKRYSDGAKCFERYLGEGEEITVEEGVRQVNNNAFENCKTLTKIVLPDTVDTICDNAFNECENIHSAIVIIEPWKNIHPLFKTIPVNWEYSTPFGIVCSKKLSLHVEKFLHATKQIFKLGSSDYFE